MNLTNCASHPFSDSFHSEKPGEVDKLLCFEIAFVRDTLDREPEDFGVTLFFSVFTCHRYIPQQRNKQGAVLTAFRSA